MTLTMWAVLISEVFGCVVGLVVGLNSYKYFWNSFCNKSMLKYLYCLLK